MPLRVLIFHPPNGAAELAADGVDSDLVTGERHYTSCVQRCAEVSVKGRPRIGVYLRLETQASACTNATDTKRD